MSQDLMISIKSLGLESNAIGLAIGAVLFDPRGPNDEHLDQKNQFYVTISNVDSTINGFTPERDTINWMRSQKNIHNNVQETMRATTPVATAFQMLVDFIEKHNPDKFWCNGVRFHFRYTEDVCARFGIKFKFPSQQEMEYRSIMDALYRNREDRPQHNEQLVGFSPQHALGDAMMQAENIKVAYLKMGLADAPSEKPNKLTNRISP